MSTGRGREVVVLLRVEDGSEVVLRRLDAGAADLALVDALARLQLVAHRLGRSIAVRDPDGRLAELIELTGLGAVIDVRSVAMELVGEYEPSPEGWVREQVEE